MEAVTSPPSSPPLDRHQERRPSQLPQLPLRRRSTLRSDSMSLGSSIGGSAGFMNDSADSLHGGGGGNSYFGNNNDGDDGDGDDILDVNDSSATIADVVATSSDAAATFASRHGNALGANASDNDTTTSLVSSSEVMMGSSTATTTPMESSESSMVAAAASSSTTTPTRASSSSSQQQQQQQQRPPVSNRRATMSGADQSHRRASIQNILKDERLSALEKRRSIQFLMDGRAQSAWRGRRSTTDCVTNPYLEARAKRGLEGERRGEGEEMMLDRMGGGGGDGGFNRRRSNSFDNGDGNDAFHDSAPDWRAVAAAAAIERAKSAQTRHKSSPSAFEDTGWGGTKREGDEEEVDEVAMMTAAAIDHATSLTETETFASMHPYKSNTTLVPGVAAQSPMDHTKSSREQARRAVMMAPECTHYVRNCHVVSPCCGATFACRICHDDSPVLPALLKDPPHAGPTKTPTMTNDDGVATGGDGGGGRKFQRMHRISSMPTAFSNSIGAPEHHKLPRFEIAEIICRECFTKQSSKTNFCANCHVQFGEYHCAICNLWMSNEERPYHCPDCGFCRVGGGENFRHCMDCGMCIDRQLFADHNCKLGKYMSNCPVCQEDLFSSRDASHELPCGHAIHWHCFRELASHDSRCPVCKKTAETHERMKPTWDAMAMGIALQPVPPELCKVVTIMCNDCEEVQVNRAWHFLGVQCRHCESFNTVVDRITMMGRDAHEFLLRENPNAVGIIGANHTIRRGGPSTGAVTGASVSRARPSPRRRRASADAVPNPHQAPPPPPFR